MGLCRETSCVFSVLLLARCVGYARGQQTTVVAWSGPWGQFIRPTVATLICLTKCTEHDTLRQKEARLPRVMLGHTVYSDAMLPKPAMCKHCNVCINDIDDCLRANISNGKYVKSAQRGCPMNIWRQFPWSAAAIPNQTLMNLETQTTLSQFSLAFFCCLVCGIGRCVH